jgi:NhaP-type Na+/H+ or K+/H+ antiporter
MALFESMLVLLAVAAMLLNLARRMRLPYPAILALAGGAVALLPFAPRVAIEPHLALALFIAPAVMQTALELPPRELIRNWLPLISLAVLLVIATTAAVAWAGWELGAMPIAAAIALGAIVAPPDAAAATAVLRQFKLPRRTMVVLQGESLLNDAVALLIFGGAVAAVSHGATADWRGSLPPLLLAVPGGAMLGLMLGMIHAFAASRVAGTLSNIIVQFTVTFGAWVLADRLHLSAIAAVVSLATFLAHVMPARTSARDRVNARAVWNSLVFVLNVLAFLLMGLQLRFILNRLEGPLLWQALRLAIVVLLVVIVVRLFWVLCYGAILRRLRRPLQEHLPSVYVPPLRVNLLIMWCGMRGLVTLATAFALPEDFPSRDLIVLSAFTVVLGTLVIQGLTIRPLIALLKLGTDKHRFAQIRQAQMSMLCAGLKTLEHDDDAFAQAVHKEYSYTYKASLLDDEPLRFQTPYDAARLVALNAQRAKLHVLRRLNRVDDDAYHILEEKLDWAELSVRPIDDSDLTEA